MLRYTLIYQSILGAILFAFTILVLYRSADSLWKTQSEIIANVAALAILINYGLQFIFLNVGIDEDLAKFIGVVKQDEKNGVIYE